MTGEKVVLFIRPENVTISVNTPHPMTSARNTFQGIITRIIPQGFFYRVDLSCGFPLVAYVTANALEELGLRDEMAVTASVKATSIHFIRKTG